MARILVVDDEEVMRSLLDKALRRWGHEVSAVTGAEEALRAYRPGHYELVLTDLRMQGASGLDLIEQLHELEPALPVIMMTAYGSIQSAVEAVRRGAADFLTKPLELSYLQLVLERTLEKQRTTQEIEQLRPLADEREALGELVGRSLPMKRVYALIDKVAASELTVLIQGETGTGKELCARAIHQESPRAQRRFQVVNCAAFQASLLESELFGHEKGAFTGADKRRIGHFEAAAGGTLFLDEVGEAPLEVQAKLLRAIQEREVTRVGGTDPIRVDVRIVAATNKDLQAEVAAGRFREDLYWRLAAFPIRLPPLRERSEDIPLLVERFLAAAGRDEADLTPEALRRLTRAAFPGNVRQLQQEVARAAVLAGDQPIGVEHLSEQVATTAGVSGALSRPGAPGAAAAGLDEGLLALPLREARDQFERLYLEGLLRRCGGNVSEAARQAGLGRASLHEKINKLGIEPDRFRG